MPDEQIERLLEETRQAFTVSEVMRPFHAYQRMFDRLGAQMDEEELRAMFVVLRLAIDRVTKRSELAVEVMYVLRDSLRSDGLFYPPPIPTVAERLGVSPVEVEEALTALSGRGCIEEVPPGIIFRRRRFRPTRPGG